MAKTGTDPCWIEDKIQVNSIEARLKASDFYFREWPRITVVTPAFNSARYIEDTIRSVNFQFYPKVEYIVSDNCSSDRTGEILEKYDFLQARITPDTGQADALNRAFKTAQGEILAWLNADDLFAPFALYKMALAFRQGKADLIAGQAVLFEANKAVSRHIYSLPDGPLLETELLNLEGMWLTGQYFYQPELFFTKDIYERAGGYVDEKLFFSMDYELWLRMARAGAQIRTISAPIALFRKHQDQKTHNVSDYQSELKQFVEGISPAKRTAKERFSGFEWSERSLKVVMLNDLGFQYGAGIAQESIAKALTLSGCEVRSFALAAKPNSAALSNGANREMLFSKIREAEPDLILIGNLHGAEVDHSWLTEILPHYPVFFVMHDFYMLTGRCAYFGDCKKHLDLSCDQNCPTFFEYPTLPVSKIAGALQSKAKLLEHPNASVIACSGYASDAVRDALSARGLSTKEIKEKVYSIWLGADTEYYFLETEKRRAELRRSFKLPTGKLIVLLPSGNYNDRRKNVQAAWRIFCALADDKFHAIVLGETPVSPHLLGDNFTHIPYISDKTRLSSLFRCSDFVINTSHDETFGQKIIEGALSGALPVSAGKGAVPEIIDALGAGFQAPLNACESAAISRAVQYMTSLAGNPKRTR
jgi:glycosyltransferase involved in cell wall biosynthesis